MVIPSPSAAPGGAVVVMPQSVTAPPFSAVSGAPAVVKPVWRYTAARSDRDHLPNGLELGKHIELAVPTS